MPKAYRLIILQSVALLILVVTLMMLPQIWIVTSGLTKNEFDKAWADASHEVLVADDPEERQSALSRAQWLYKYDKYGHVGEKTNLMWVLIVTRFTLLVAILSLCWSLISKIRREFMRPEHEVDVKLIS